MLLLREPGGLLPALPRSLSLKFDYCDERFSIKHPDKFLAKHTRVWAPSPYWSTTSCSRAELIGRTWSRMFRARHRPGYAEASGHSDGLYDCRSSLGQSDILLKVLQHMTFWRPLTIAQLDLLLAFAQVLTSCLAAAFWATLKSDRSVQ